MKRAGTAVAIAVIAAAVPSSPAQVRPGEHWKERTALARAYAKKRAGRVSFAVVHDGRLRGGHHLDEQHYAASLSKAMLLVAYLDRARGRRLSSADRGLLGPMIKESDNRSAHAVYRIVGSAGLARVGRRARMRALGLPPWGWANTRVTARDQARFFSRIDWLVPRRHRLYARTLLKKIIPYQRWGIARAAPRGWRVYFKTGWRPGVMSQAALLQRGRERIAIAVLTDGAKHVYMRHTVEGVARRLLGGADRLRSATS